MQENDNAEKLFIEQKIDEITQKIIDKTGENSFEFELLSYGFQDVRTISAAYSYISPILEKAFTLIQDTYRSPSEEAQGIGKASKLAEVSEALYDILESVEEEISSKSEAKEQIADIQNDPDVLDTLRQIKKTDPEDFNFFEQADKFFSSVMGNKIHFFSETDSEKVLTKACKDLTTSIDRFISDGLEASQSS